MQLSEHEIITCISHDNIPIANVEWSVTTHVFACREVQKRPVASSIIPRMFYVRSLTYFK
jgi:hypothetical protein